MKVIILAGGSGKRLWPLSRTDNPKQFIKFRSDSLSLFGSTFIRCLLLTQCKEIYIITNEKYKQFVIENIEDLGYDPNEVNILIEPEGKNTLPAIYAGVYELSKKGSDLVVVFPSDHYIVDNQKFIKCIKESRVLAKDHIITFGIEPDFPNTGFGYISPSTRVLNGYKVKAFKEKPNYETAITYMEEGSLWNSGIFMFDSNLFTSEVKKYAYNIYDAFKKTDNLNDAFLNIDDNISIDYGIIEKTIQLAVVPIDIGWNDLGSFDDFAKTTEDDENKNQIINGDAVALNSNNNFIYTDKNKLIATIGVNDLFIIDSSDVLLICKKNQTQQVKDVVEILEERKDKRIESHIQTHRPWGDYKILEEEKNMYKIKKISVKIGRKLSYQMHNHRSESWVVIQGTAGVTIDGIVQVATVGESVFIKPKQKHRLENIGEITLIILELQRGDYLEEDDITRFEDSYGRV